MKEIFLLAFILSVYVVLNAQTGTPDLSFGNNGYVTSPDAATGHSSLQAVKACFLHPDGKLSLALQEGGKAIVSQRLSNGAPDLSYGQNGFSMVVSMIITCAGAQADGKIVVAGTTNGSADFMLARYNTDGTLDASFGNAGTVISDIGSTADLLNAVAITPAGKIIAAGSTRSNGIDKFVMAGYNPDGTPDNSFGTNSIVTTDFGGTYSSIYSLYLQPDGKILAAGSVSTFSGDFALARYNPDGSPDLSFHATGTTSSDFGSGDAALSVITDNTGRVYLGGFSNDASGFRRFRVARYDADGNADLTYNLGSGSSSPSFGGSDEVISNIRLLPDGSVVASGYTGLDPANYNIAVIHILIDGTVDKSFGNNGLLLADYNAGYDESDFLLVQPDGKILTGGGNNSQTNPINGWFSCFRYNENGPPDADFGNNGVMVDFFPEGYNYYSSVFVQADGKITTAGESYSGTDQKLLLDRFTKTGVPDSSFGVAGRKELNYESGTPVFQSDGKLIKISYSTTNNGDFMLLRYNTDGSPDAGFGTGGRVISDFGGMESAAVAALQPDGKIIVGGLTRDASGSDWLVVRYNPDGSIDGSFGINGAVRKNIMTEESVQCISIAPDGKILLGSSAFNYPVDVSYLSVDIILGRLNTDGSFDTGFGNQGIVIVDRSINDFLGSIAVQNDGKTVFGYLAGEENANLKAFLERLNTDGSSDTNFGENGKTSADANTVTLAPDQKILVTGNKLNGYNNNDFSLTRFTKDGSLDASFGNAGKTIVSFTGVHNYFYFNLFSGNSLYCVGNGVTKWGKTVSLLAKFQLEPALSCPVSQELATDSNFCSAKVYNIDPSISCASGTQINYTLSGATTGAGTCSASGQTFNKGITTVTYFSGADITKGCSFTVTVLDKQLPVINNLATNAPTLWPADHRMKDVTVDYILSDNCDIKNTQLTVTSNEPVTGGLPDWQIIDAHHIRLRAERLERGSGRVYTITVTTTDLSGNQQTKTTLVKVPKYGVPDCKLNVNVAPNPSHRFFLVTVGSGCDDRIYVKVFNCNGALMGYFNDVNAHGVLRIGDRFPPGIYYLEARQSSNTKTVKLIKL